MAIPLFVMEEHNEAFLLWQVAIRRGLMPARGNALLHVDEHNDIRAPRLQRSVLTAVHDLRRTAALAFDELSCSGFIVPALALGLFDDLVWVRCPRAADAEAEFQARAGCPTQLLVVRATDAGRAFDLGRHDVVEGRPAPADVETGDGVVVRYARQSAADPLPPLSQVVLDIDLDYVSSEEAAHVLDRVEVVKAEFDAFRTNRHHPLRVMFGSDIQIVEEEGRYFVQRQDPRARPGPSPLRATEAMILERLDALVDMLRRQRVRPLLIEIARSRYSGYTPADQWVFIEQALIERLGSLYDLEPQSLDAACEALGASWSGAEPRLMPVEAAR